MTRQRTRGHRRPMAIAIGIAAAAVLAAGCGSSGGSSSGGGATSNAATQNGGGAVAGATVPTAGLPVLQTIGKGEGQLNLIAWEGYLDPKWVKPFEQQTGCQVNAKYAGSSDEMVALMKNGGGELVVSRQNTEGPDSGEHRCGRVRLAWRPEQAFTIPSGEG